MFADGQTRGLAWHTTEDGLLGVFSIHGQEGSEPHFGVDVASGRFHWRRREKEAESHADRDDGEEEREKSSWRPLFKSLSST
jgi:hypothetical protein